MKLFEKASDGGKDSGVTGYFLIEAKSLFSIVLLRFSKGTREAYHSHAFNAFTIWLKGRILEHDVNEELPAKVFSAGHWKYTPREKFHKVEALETSWALSFRGPWSKTWFEQKGGKLVELTNGRQVVNERVV
jgi:quercetin dioxygenase-like cupin family protein